MSGFEPFLTPTVKGLAVAVLVMIMIAGIGYSFFGQFVSGDKRRNQRLQTIATRDQSEKARKALKDTQKRKQSVQNQLSEFEERQKQKQLKSKVPLKAKFEQAGMEWQMKHFFIFSAVCGVVFFVVGLVLSGNLWIGFGFGFAGSLGFPRWYVNNKRNRRFKAFLDEMPNAVDIIVRGVKAGLPLADCIKLVAREAREPVATEFRNITETQVLGVSLPDAVGRMPDRVPLPEASFFAIVVAIQAQTGGGLAEALGNLSRVLRGRITMKRKIKAVSSEAKSSAMIIGSLPFAMGTILYLIAPDYIGLLFSTTGGNIVIAGCLFWMFLGVLIMRKMINFEV